MEEEEEEEATLADMKKKKKKTMPPHVSLHFPAPSVRPSGAPFNSIQLGVYPNKISD